MKEILAALVAVQATCEAPKKNAANPHFKSKFADLAQVLGVLRQPMAEQGLAIVQTPSLTPDGKSVSLTTTLYHKSGESLDCGTLTMPVERPGPQAVGSAITYARRYALTAIFALAAEDDDGENAEERPPAKAAKDARTMDDVAGLPGAVPPDQYEGTNVAELIVDLPRCATKPTLISWAQALNGVITTANKNAAWRAWGAQCEKRDYDPAELAKEART